MKDREVLHIIITAFFVFLPISLMGQKKELLEARINLKEGKNLEQVETSMRKLLGDSTNKQNHKIWLTLSESIQKQYEQGNEQLYLKQNYDTTKLFVLAKKLFDTYESFDSIDASPNRKGEIKPKYRKKHAEILYRIKKNIFAGGNYYIKRNDYSNALQMFDTYLSIKSSPLFSIIPNIQNDSLLPQVASLAVYCTYKTREAEKVDQYQALALTDTANLNNNLMWIAEINKQKQDSVQEERCLRKGFELYPMNTYFFGNLFNLYLQQNKMDDAEVLVKKALKIQSSNSIFRLAKTAILLYQEKYAECIQICDQLIAENDTMATPYLNAGLAYYRRAIPFEGSTVNSTYNKTQLKKYYQAALPYLEKYRELRPADEELWIKPLYNIYLTLNMGQQFDELEQIINQNPALTKQ